MAREILFRGKCIETGAWYEGQYIHLHKTTYCFAGSAQRDAENEIHQIVFEQMTDWNLPNRHLRVDVIPETVGQYTGLTDKNGKKIFEGDIVNFSDILYYIVFADGCFRIGRNGQYSYTLHNIHSAFEIIGNIHDNPELLKGGGE